MRRFLPVWLSVVLVVAWPARGAGDPELRRLEGHTDAVMAVAFSPDGTLLATASNDKTAGVWEVATGKRLHRLAGHASTVTAVAFSGDGKRLVTASTDRTARVWDLAGGGAMIAELKGKHASHVHAADLSADGTRVVTGSCDFSVVVWDVDDEKPLHTARCPGEVHVVEFAPDGKTFLAGTRSADERVLVGKNLHLFDATARLTKSYDAPSVVDPGGLQFTADGRRVLLGNLGELWVLDVAAGKLAKWARPKPGVVSFSLLAATPDGASFVSAGTSMLPMPMAHIDFETGKKLGEFPVAGGPDTMRSVAISPDGKVAALAGGGRGAPWGAYTRGRDYTVRLVSLAGGAGGAAAAAGGAARPFTIPYTGRGAAPGTVLHRQSTDGARVLTANSANVIAWWEAASGKEIARLSPPRARTALAHSADLNRVAVGDRAGKVLVYEPGKAEPVMTLADHDGRHVRALSFTPDGRYLFAAEGPTVAQEARRPAGGDSAPAPEPPPAKPADGYRVWRWDLSTGTASAAMAGSGWDAVKLSAAPDGRTVLGIGTAEDPAAPDALYAWDAETGKVLWKRGPFPPVPGKKALDYTAVAVSADGARAVYAFDYTAAVVEVKTGKVVSTLNRHQNVVDAVAFDPDNRRVWTVAVQDAIRAWDAGTGRVVRTVSLNGLDGMYTAFELREGRRVLYLRARGQIQERNLGD